MVSLCLQTASENCSEIFHIVWSHRRHTVCAQCHETHASTALQHTTPSEYRQVDCHCWSILYSGTDSLIVISLKDTPLLCWPRPLSICLLYIEDETVNSGSVVDAAQDICNQRYRHTPVILTGQGRVTLVTKWQSPQW